MPAQQQQQQQQQQLGGGGFADYGQSDGAAAGDGVDYEVGSDDADGDEAGAAVDEEAVEEALDEILQRPLMRWKTRNFHGATEGAGTAVGGWIRSVSPSCQPTTSSLVPPSSSSSLVHFSSLLVPSGFGSVDLFNNFLFHLPNVPTILYLL